MSRIMVLNAGMGAALLATLMMERATLGVGPSEVIIVDDSLPPSPGDENTPQVMSTKDADVLIIGAGGRDLYGSGLAGQALTMCCPEVYLLPEEQSYRDIRQARQQSRHKMDRKQQSMQAKARRR